MKPPPNLEILPIAAVGLVLVLIMMVLAPLVESHNSIPVVLPQTHTSERKIENSVTITYTKQGTIVLDDKTMTSLDMLGDSVHQRLQKDPYVLVVVRADKDVESSNMLDILTTVRKAGALRIACATKRLREG